MRYDESDNVVIRASRIVTDKLVDIFGVDNSTCCSIGYQDSVISHRKRAFTF